MNTNRTVFFSATGTTKTVVERISDNIASKTTLYYDLLTNPQQKTVECGPGELLIVGMPVYAGRIPAICTGSLAQFKGNNTPAIAVVAYGNRDYDDALLELSNILTGNGFNVIAAGAFVAQHSIFNSVGAGRPDEHDITVIDAFSKQCTEKLENLSVNCKSIMPKGNFPYRPANNVPLKPTGNDSCIDCGDCIEICPTKAIPADNPRLTTAELCISCCACIAVCPVGSRGFHIPVFSQIEADFRQKNEARKEPEFFI